MVHALEEHEIMCPYCGEFFNVLIDRSVNSQQYTEDCEVCCSPIAFEVVTDDNGTLHIATERENG